MASSTEPQAPGTLGQSVLRRYLKEPINAFQTAVTNVHDALGVPWWATIVGAGICARACTLPLSLRAVAAGTNFVRSRKAIEKSTFTLLGDAGFAACTPALVPHTTRLPILTEQFAERPYSPRWLLAPLVQVPILTVTTLSFMSLDHPALATEGCLWFPNLMKAAVSFEGVSDIMSSGNVYMTNEESEALRKEVTPMGVAGVILPTAFYVLWQHNLSKSMQTVSYFYFNTVAKSTFESGVLRGASRAQTGINRNVMAVQLMSLLIYPLFVSVPTSGLLYLTTSSATVWLTFRVLPLLMPSLKQSSSTPARATSTAGQESLTSSGTESLSIAPDSISKGTVSRSDAIVSTTASPLTEIQGMSDVEELVNSCILNHAKKHNRLALAAAERAQELEPKHSRITFAVAQLHRDLRQWKEALNQLNNCLLLEPDSNSAHRARVLATKSVCLLELRKPADALKAATEAVLLQPEEPMHWIAKMNALRSSGDIAGAIKDAKHVAELDPDLGRNLPEVLEKLQKSKSSPVHKQRARG